MKRIGFIVGYAALNAVGCGGGGGGECCGEEGTIAGDASNGGPSSRICQTTQRLVSRPAARLLLDAPLLARLQERVSAGDAAWRELERTCNEYAGSTVEAPGGTKYLPYPNITSGYQGDEYYNPMVSLALCYRAAAAADPENAARYAAQGERVLVAMSTPPEEGGATPSTNSGYGIRFYGTAMALGYDWLYPVLSASTRQRVVSALNRWIDWYDESGFLREEPVANYFAGYFAAKTFTALATEGDNPMADAYWDDIVGRMWPGLVQPALTDLLSGGGWPEGWGYGPRAVRNFAEALWAAKTARGMRWVNEASFVRDQGLYVLHFAWPSLKSMDDRGTVRAGISLQPSAGLVSELATILEQLGDGTARLLRDFGDDVVATGDDRKPWEKFLFSGSAPSDSARSDLPASYIASGPAHAAMRGSWDAGAVWGSLAGGPYINAERSGEQLFDAGSVTVVVGGQPLLVNATGFIPQAGGAAGEDFVYEDSWGAGTRRLYNTFFVNDPSNPYNPGQNTIGPDTSAAGIGRFEDAGRYVRVRAEHLEDQYGGGGAQPVQEFTRDLVFVRPGTFVIHDETLTTLDGADQWMAFHTPSAPVRMSDPGQSRFDVSAGGARAGTVSVLLPANARVDSVPLPAGVSRLEAHAAAGDRAQRWLSVVTAGPEAPALVRLSEQDGNASASAVGVHALAARDQVVVFGPGDETLEGFEYTIRPSTTSDHVLVNLAASDDGYKVSATPNGDALTVHVEPGGPLVVSTNGTVTFELSKGGEMSIPPPPEAVEPTGTANSGQSSVQTGAATDDSDC